MFLDKLLRNKLKRILQKIIQKIIPRKLHLPLYFYYFKIRKYLEPEMFYVEKLIDKKERFLDIGSNVGIYSYYFRNKFKFINSFEPLEELSNGLKSLNLKNIKIHNKAISNQKGKLTLHIPLLLGNPSSGLASLEERNVLCEERLVEIETIDSFYFDDVSLIKIDVEGHELSVLQGSIETIKRCKPIILVEIEQRHINRDIKDVFSEFLDLNYEGFFLRKNKLIPLYIFDCKKHQKPFLKSPLNNVYINNFIFSPLG